MLSVFFQPYIIVPLILIIIGVVFIKECNIPVYLFFVAAVIGFLSFHIATPSQGWDLYWHYKTLDNYRDMGFTYFAIFDKSISLPIYSLYFYLISLLPYNEYLPAITSFLVYGLNFILIYKIYKRFDLSKRTLWILVVFILCNLNYFGVISGIRFNLAVSLCTVALYYDYIERKKIIPILLFLFAVLIHSSIYIIIMVRVMLFFFRKKGNAFFAITAVAVTFLMINILPNMLSAFNLGGLSDSIDELLYKTDMYMQNIEKGAFWTTGYYFLLFTFFISIFVLFYMRYKWYNDNMSKLMLSQIVIFALIVVFFNNYVVLGRLIIMSNLLMMPYLGVLIGNNSKVSGFRNATRIEALVFLESILRLVYYVALGGYATIHMQW